MAEIFICYQHFDAPGIAHALHSKLASEFGKDENGKHLVFLDRQTQPDREDWREELTRELKLTSILLVVIGPKWDAARLHNPNDDVRWEIELASAYKKTCIAVFEPPRVCRRLQALRGWSDEQAFEQVFC